MQLIEGIALSKLCDYSFGDQSGKWGNIHTSFMKSPSLTNTEFVSKLFEVKKSRNYMTLFIDNIRLYKRNIVECKEEDRSYIESLWEEGDLLSLCGYFPNMNFIIFTNLEDTPIDEYIFNLIPKNVLKISAVNAISNNEKVIPAPYGIQRAMSPSDMREKYLMEALDKNIEINSSKLLYVSHKENSHQERIGIKQLFRDKDWSIVDIDRVEYIQFLRKLSQCKFMICPRGNAIDCHRNWEVLYMRRVPIMKKHPYLKELFKGYPVLFVDNYSEVTKELLEASECLFQQALSMDLSLLTLPKFFDKIVSDSLK